MRLNPWRPEPQEPTKFQYRKRYEVTCDVLFLRRFSLAL